MPTAPMDRPVWRTALASGLFLGALWGAVEAGVHQARYVLPSWSATGVMAPVNPVTAVAVTFQAAWRYALLGVVVALAGALLLGWLLDRRPGRPHAGGRAVVALAVFLNVYWYTKLVPWLQFHAGLPFSHPYRLALSAGYLVLALAVAVALVGPGRLGAPRGRLGALLLAVLAAGAGWAEWRESRLVGFSDRAPPEGRPPNVLLVVVDALRADRLGCYGYDVREPPISPRVDALAAEGVVYERTVVQAPFTWTSFGSFLTGKYPRQHGLMNMLPNQRLDPARNRTVAKALQEEGWVTGAFLTGTLSNNSGLLDGFDTYFETIKGHEPVTRSSKWSIVKSDLLINIFKNKIRQKLDDRLVNTEAMDWMRSVAHRPFFAMVHYYSTHTPYGPPAPYDTMYDDDYEGIYHPFYQSHGKAILEGRLEFTERDLEHVNALYDGGVAFADAMFGDLLDLLEELGVADDTLVLYTSDHGEELYEQRAPGMKRVFEHDWMFNTNLYIPLVVRFPGRAHAGARVTHLVEAMDIPATIVETVGRGRLDEGPGRSLVPDAAGEPLPPGEGAVFSENNRYVAMLLGDKKIVATREALNGLTDDPRQVRLYDLAVDPLELALPLTGEALDRAPWDRLWERMLEYHRSQPSLSSLPTFDVDPEMLERLQQTGYIGGEYLGPNEMTEEQLIFGDAPGDGDGEGEGEGASESEDEGDG